MATFTNNEIGTGKDDKVFVNGLGVMTGGTTAAGNMKRNNGAKAVGADLDYSSVDYDYDSSKTYNDFLADTDSVVLKEGSRKNTVVGGQIVEASTWGQSLVPKTTGTFMYNGGVTGDISEVVGEGKDTYRVYIEKGGEGNPEGFTDGKDTLISSGVAEEIANELVRQQKAYIIGGNVLEARGSEGYTSEKITPPPTE